MNKYLKRKIFAQSVIKAGYKVRVLKEKHAILLEKRVDQEIDWKN